MDTVKPTRSALIELKKKVEIAKSGHHLLEKKRDGLVQEFFDVLEDTRERREKLRKRYAAAKQKLDIARALHSDHELEALSLAILSAPGITLAQENIMGTRVPRIESRGMVKPLLDRGYGLLRVEQSVNDACRAYEELMEDILRVAEAETATRRLTEEIGKTKRRVNALEYEIIPALEKRKQDIMMRLDEIERESIFRQKMIKRKRRKG